jgi:hypothetical protein
VEEASAVATLGTYIASMEIDTQTTRQRFEMGSSLLTHVGLEEEMGDGLPCEPREKRDPAYQRPVIAYNFVCVVLWFDVMDILREASDGA